MTSDAENCSSAHMPLWPCAGPTATLTSRTEVVKLTGPNVEVEDDGTKSDSIRATGSLFCISLKRGAVVVVVIVVVVVNVVFFVVVAVAVVIISVGEGDEVADGDGSIDVSVVSV